MIIFYLQLRFQTNRILIYHINHISGKSYKKGKGKKREINSNQKR